jgi:hypothetical protein
MRHWQWVGCDDVELGCAAIFTARDVSELHAKKIIKIKLE